LRLSGHFNRDPACQTGGLVRIRQTFTVELLSKDP
jgi:hypothetical protein